MVLAVEGCRPGIYSSTIAKDGSILTGLACDESAVEEVVDEVDEVDRASNSVGDGGVVLLGCDFIGEFNQEFVERGGVVVWGSVVVGLEDVKSLEEDVDENDDDDDDVDEDVGIGITIVSEGWRMGTESSEVRGILTTLSELLL